ncbi:hypothetical protein Vadar_008125 [Vaccinium darrowii]|uniref:Uncharacterized protein n=1 Tax=Vaccinium darrowii TaxID=229202 RepID=A0ACB7Z3X4_9ERIC|nr:hypothetical protein Vadar_008125 [Vaccinium darrowii]
MELGFFLFPKGRVEIGDLHDSAKADDSNGVLEEKRTTGSGGGGRGGEGDGRGGEVALHLLESSSFISKSLDKIRRKLTSTDLATKSTALQKLTYLCSLHSVDDSFAAFHAVKLTSSPRFHHKKIGYLAADNRRKV